MLVCEFGSNYCDDDVEHQAADHDNHYQCVVVEMKQFFYDGGGCVLES